MDGNQPLRPQGNTFVINATPAAGGATFSGPNPNAGEVDYLMYNPGSTDAYVGYGMSSGAAVAKAAVPVIGASAEVVMVPHGLMKTYTLTPNLYFAAITQLGSTSVQITPGYGG